MSIEQLDLRLVRYFVTVGEELHFGRAASRLHIAQPSLSHQVRRLEDQLGVLLLTRTSRRVELTQAGSVLLAEGRALLEHSRQVLSSTRAVSSERLVVGFFGSAAATLLPQILRRFEVDHQSSDVTLRELFFDQLEEVADGRVDLAFTRLLPAQVEDIRIEIEILGGERRMLVVPSGHRLADRESVQMDELGAESFVINPSIGPSPPARWLAEQHRHGLRGHVAAEATSLQELLTVVAAGRGVSLVPAPVGELHPRVDVAYVPVSDAEPAVVSVARPAGRQRPIAKAFIDQARTLISPPPQQSERNVTA